MSPVPADPRDNLPRIFAKEPAPVTSILVLAVLVLSAVDVLRQFPAVLRRAETNARPPRR
jgi:hypothetical protein